MPKGPALQGKYQDAIAMVLLIMALHEQKKKMFFGFGFFIGELRCVPYLVAIRHVLVDYCKCTRIKLFQSIRTSLSRLWKEQRLMTSYIFFF